MPYRDYKMTYQVFIIRCPYTMVRYDKDLNVVDEEVYWDTYLEEMINKKASEGYKLVSHSMVSGISVSNPLDPRPHNKKRIEYGYVISCVFTLG